MRLRPTHFDRHIANLGQELLWQHSNACPCVDPHSGAPDPKHALCKGKGYFWDDPVLTVCGVPNQSTNQKMIAAGLWDSGDMTLVIPRTSPMWERAGKYDRVVMLDSTDAFSMPLKRGAPTERLLFKVAKFERVFWLHATTRLPVEGALPSVDENGNLSWSGSGAPPAGVVYSVSGQKYSEYFIFDHYPSDRNEHSGVQLPKKVQLRRWDLFGR